MKLFRLLFLFTVLLSAVSAVYIDFKNDRSTSDPMEPYHFGTDVRFESNIESCRVITCPYGAPADCVLSGTPCSGPATVCPGTTLGVTPRAQGRWAAPSLDIFSLYPFCDTCPYPTSYSTVYTNRPLKWLSDSTYTKYDAGAGGHAAYDFCLRTTCRPTTLGQSGLDVYSELGTFYSQRMTYMRLETEGPITNRRGEANVFCNGDIAVWYAGGPFGTQNIPTSGGAYSEASIPLIGGEGTALLTPTISNAKCFGSVVKYPLDLDNDNFRIYFFGYNMPTMAPQTGTSTYVTVENRQPSLDVVYVRVTEYGSVYIVEVWVYNDGDVPVSVNRVVPNGPGTTTSLGPFTCLTYGIPTPPCPTSSGFGETIPVGGLKSVFVLYSGELDEDLFDLHYGTTENVCSALTEWDVTVTIDPDVTSCRIRPSSLEVDPYEVHEYEVTCYNILGTPVPCSGDRWYWSTLAGGFVDRTNQDALAFAYSPGGSTGRLYYQDASGIRCYSDVTISDEPHTPDYYRCEMDPTSVMLGVGGTQYFDLTSYLDDVEVIPDDASYLLTGGLGGSLTEQSVNGVRFTATTESFGLIRAYSEYTVTSDSTLRGAICAAVVRVEGNATDRFVCELVPNSTSMEIGDSEDFDLRCYFDGAPVTPDTATCSLIDGLSGTLTGCSVTGVTFTGTTNSSGRIQVYAEYTPPGESLFGTNAHAYVVVGEGGGEGPGPGDGGEGDKSRLCEILPNDIEKPRYDSGSVAILCGEDPLTRGPCTPGSVRWEMDPDVGIVLGSESGAIYTLTGEVGEYGLLIARIGDEIGCWADVLITEPTCIEYT